MKTHGRRLFRDAGSIVFATERERRKASEFVDTGNSRVVRWPVRALATDNRGYARKEFRRKNGLPRDSRILLFLGRLHSMKRPVETIDCFAKSSPPSDCILCIVGNDGDLTQKQLTALVPDSLEEQIVVTGPLWGADRDEAILASDAFVSLSYRENFGHTVAEAMSAGLPVILSPGNDLAGELIDRQPGYILNSNEGDEAIVALKWFYDLKALASEEIGSSNRNWVRSELQFANFREQLKGLRRELLGDRGDWS
ncbi:MAG: glycosyltransferase [Planctomycetota bacterium]